VLKQLGYDLKHADFSYLKDGWASINGML
jgi:hypothetical protein